MSRVLRIRGQERGVADVRARIEGQDEDGGGLVDVPTPSGGRARRHRRPDDADHGGPRTGGHP